MKIRRISKEDYVEMTAPVDRIVRDEDGSEYNASVSPQLLIVGDRDDTCDLEISKTANGELIIYWYDAFKDEETILLVKDDSVDRMMKRRFIEIYLENARLNREYGKLAKEMTYLKRGE